MPIAESMLPEFDHETATTRILLERVPEASADWRPHAKSRSLGELAMHIANIPHWSHVAIERTWFDTNPADGQAATTPPFQSAAHLMQFYDEGVRASRALLGRTTDAEFMVPWTLKSGGKALFSLPRVAVFRSFILNHAVHHRGQLSVYLRLLDIPLSSIYGPTADSEPLGSRL